MTTTDTTKPPSLNKNDLWTPEDNHRARTLLRIQLLLLVGKNVHVDREGKLKWFMIRWCIS